MVEVPFGNYHRACFFISRLSPIYLLVRYTDISNKLEDVPSPDIVSFVCSDTECQSTYGEAQARDICKIVVHTLKYLHSQGIVHGNLSPSTLMLADPDDDSSIVLTDFTHARSIRDGFVTTENGNPEFKAPEILRGVPHGTVRG